jgi:Cyclic GMP-AMP synthase DncV-like, nucleotidyltransferase domain
MYDFSTQIADFHERHVRLTNAQRANMRERRRANVDRIEKGLEELDKPSFAETINQGGYAQKTMTQPPEADHESRYDIDLGVVFGEEDSAGPRTMRGWVRDAIARKATNMKNEPETKKKCVRVVYADGYQCDFPVLRRRRTGVGWYYELASGDEWVASDPQSMNAWIDEQVSARSPETTSSRQLRRVIRMGKFFSKTHADRSNRKLPGGLVATALFIEAYVPAEGRDDEAFRETLRAISNRSKHSSVYANGVQVSDEKDVDRIARLIEEASASVRELDKLDTDNTTESDARKAWKKVFRHSFFDEAVSEAASALEKKSVLGGGLAGTRPLVAPSVIVSPAKPWTQ